MPPPGAVREQLERILNSRALAGSDQLKKLLRVSVERSLDGQTESTKEYTLGVEALGRPEGYDPKVDPIVRVQARRLRAKLEEYYASEGADDRIVIAIPKGAYVPTFEARNGSRRNLLTTTLVPGLLIAAAGAGFWFTRPKAASGLSVAVLPIRNLTGDPAKQYLADKTTEALITGLARSGSLRVVSNTTTRRYANSQESLPEIAKIVGARWIVEGGMGFERGRVILKMRAVDAESDQKVWADFFESEVDALSAAQARAAAAITESVQRKAAASAR